jgi:hypothetical protein
VTEGKPAAFSLAPFKFPENGPIVFSEARALARVGRSESEMTFQEIQPRLNGAHKQPILGTFAIAAGMCLEFEKS